MEIQPLKIGTKMAKVPVIQGGMGVGISLGNLAGAVAKEGGIGIISAAQPGFKEKDFEKNPLEANLRAVKSEYEKARKLAPNGIIGFNLMVAMERICACGGRSRRRSDRIGSGTSDGTSEICGGFGHSACADRIYCKVGECHIKVLG